VPVKRALAALLAAAFLLAAAAARPVTAHPRAPAPGARLAAGIKRDRPGCDPYASSLRPSGPPQVTSGSYMARIKARGYLIAGVDQNTYHFGFLNPLDGKIEGFDIDMIRAVAQAIFGDSDKVRYKAITDGQRIPAIQSGRVDIVAHTMWITCDRLRLVDFSAPYFDARQKVLVPKGSPATGLADLGGQKVCATAGSLSLAVIAAQPSHPIPVAVPYWTDCLVMLQQGDVAAISTDAPILAGLAAQDPWTKIVGPSLLDRPYGMAISQQHPDFVRFVNAVLEQVRSDHRWAASYARWIGTPVPAPPAVRYAG
jgi:polar amino acid transport system substrate-binding protein